MELILLTTVFASVIQSGNALEVALGCTILLVIMWYLTDSKQTSTQERLYGNVEVFAIPLLFTFICGMLIQIVRILAV